METGKRMGSDQAKSRVQRAGAEWIEAGGGLLRGDLASATPAGKIRTSLNPLTFAPLHSPFFSPLCHIWDRRFLPSPYPAPFLVSPTKFRGRANV
jgi:hypothetical protein